MQNGLQCRNQLRKCAIDPVHREVAGKHTPMMMEEEEEEKRGGMDQLFAGGKVKRVDMSVCMFRH